MKTGKRSERRKLIPVDSQIESSTGALEGTAELGPRERQGRCWAPLLPSQDRQLTDRQRDRVQAFHIEKGT